MSKCKTYLTIITENEVYFKTVYRDVHDLRTLQAALTFAKSLKPGNKIYFGAHRYDLSTPVYTGYLIEVILRSCVSLYRCSGNERKAVGIKDLHEHFRNIGG